MAQFTTGVVVLPSSRIDFWHMTKTTAMAIASMIERERSKDDSQGSSEDWELPSVHVYKTHIPSAAHDKEDHVALTFKYKGEKRKLSIVPWVKCDYEDDLSIPADQDVISFMLGDYGHSVELIDGVLEAFRDDDHQLYMVEIVNSDEDEVPVKLETSRERRKKR